MNWYYHVSYILILKLLYSDFSSWLEFVKKMLSYVNQFRSTAREVRRYEIRKRKIKYQTQDETAKPYKQMPSSDTEAETCAISKQDKNIIYPHKLLCS